MFLVPYKNKRNSTPSSLFDSLFDDWHSSKPVSSSSPKVNVSEDDKGYYFSVQLSGYDEKNVDVSFTEGVLTLKGEIEKDATEESKTLCHHEFTLNSFERSFKVPGELIEKKIEAKFGKGILNITLPKKEEEKPQVHKINVKSE